MNTKNRVDLVDSGNRHSAQAEEARLNHARRAERDAFFRRFGYDSDAAVEFVLAKALPLPGPVLDIATGKGRFVVALARHCTEVTTVDISANEQRFARLEAAHVGVAGRIRFVIRDAAKLPWRSARFGAVVSMNAFHHMDNPDRVFAEMLRVLRPGGKLVLADFTVGGFRLMDKIHRAEGRIHPHPPSRFAPWKVSLLRLGFRVKRFRGCYQDVLIAVAPTISAVKRLP
jgi:ubiquinone/menaquinone biosynthesis C-methylase UbiE